MPVFDKGSNGDGKKGRGGKGAESKPAPVADTRVMEPRCNVCKHKDRKLIDRALATGRYGYRELERTFAVDHRSISNHDKNHLNLKDAAMRQLVLEQAQDEEEFTSAVRGQMKWRLYLETALDSAMDAVINGDVTVEPRDAVALIEKLEAFENATAESQLATIKIEFHAYLQAMKEIVADEMWNRILNRAQAIALRSKIDKPDDEPQQIDG